MQCKSPYRYDSKVVCVMDWNINTLPNLLKENSANVDCYNYKCKKRKINFCCKCVSGTRNSLYLPSSVVVCVWLMLFILEWSTNVYVVGVTSMHVVGVACIIEGVAWPCYIYIYNICHGTQLSLLLSLFVITYFIGYRSMLWILSSIEHRDDVHYR